MKLPRIKLVSRNPLLVECWMKELSSFREISFHNCSILETEADAFVSPANSFGFMEGGIDQVYLDFFGMNLEGCIREMIQKDYHGEMLVGQADILETGNSRVPFLVVAPTMRVPMKIVGTINPFLAFRAILLLAANSSFSRGKYEGSPVRNYVRSIAIPGLGTGVGGISPQQCAHQMKQAITDISLWPENQPKTWQEAIEQDYDLRE